MKLWNPTQENIEFKYDGRIYVLKPDQSINVSSEMNRNCLQDFSHLGLVSVKEGDSLEMKRKEGLKNLYENKWGQLVSWNSFKDDKRNHGQSILGEYPRVKQLRREIFALENELGIDSRMDPEVYEEMEAKSHKQKRKYVRSKKVNDVNISAT